MLVLLPLIAREMRSAARQSFTYSLRLLGAGSLLATCALITIDGSTGMDLGGRLFVSLHATSIAAIWLIVPLLTADCISRERREGTLPLLFLTPLRPWHIVIAKGMAQGLRAFTLWLAVLPVLTIPFVAGGVSWLEGVLSLLLSLSSICLAMAAGLLASTRTRTWTRALTLAACLSIIFFCAFALELGFLASGGGMALPFAFGVGRDPGAWGLFGFGFELAFDLQACWRNLLGATLSPWLINAGYISPVRPLGANLPLVLNFAIAAGSAICALVLLIALAAWNVNRAWREEAPSARVARLRQTLCTPVVGKILFRRWMRWELNHNPIGWLEQRTWSARLVSWSWFAVFICIYSSLLANLWLYQHVFHGIQTFLASVLVGSVGLSAAGSFRRERETGVLELLLVSPLREWQIIGGRVRGLWTQFLPAIVLLLVVWVYCASFLVLVGSEVPSVLYYGSMLLTLPVIGLYQSLARTSFISAVLGTVLLGVALPMALGRLNDLLDVVLWLSGRPNMLYQASDPSTALAIFSQLLVAGFCAWRLQRNLKTRRFSLERSAA